MWFNMKKSPQDHFKKGLAHWQQNIKNEDWLKAFAEDW